MHPPKLPASLGAKPCQLRLALMVRSSPYVSEHTEFQGVRGTVGDSTERESCLRLREAGGQEGRVTCERAGDWDSHSDPI